MSNKEGLNITIIGKMGEGKTTFIKRYIKNKRAIIFDVNNEYDFTTDTTAPVSRDIVLDHKLFVKICLTKRNTVCVFEDATGFIEGRLAGDFRQLLVSKRHTGNVSILVFHSISAVPPRALQLSDYVILFKTSDEDYQVIERFPRLVEKYKGLLKAPPNSFEIIKY